MARVLPACKQIRWPPSVTPRWQRVTAAQNAEPNVQTEAVSRGVALVGRLAAQASWAGSETTGPEVAVINCQVAIMAFSTCRKTKRAGFDRPFHFTTVR